MVVTPVASPAPTPGTCATRGTSSRTAGGGIASHARIIPIGEPHVRTRAGTEDGSWPVQSQRGRWWREAHPGNLILADSAAALGGNCQRSDEINWTGILPRGLCCIAARIRTSRNQAERDLLVRGGLKADLRAVRLGAIYLRAWDRRVLCQRESRPFVFQGSSRIAVWRKT